MIHRILSSKKWNGRMVRRHLLLTRDDGRGQVNQQIEIIRKRANDGLTDWGETAISSVHAFSVPKLVKVFIQVL